MRLHTRSLSSSMLILSRSMFSDPSEFVFVDCSFETWAMASGASVISRWMVPGRAAAFAPPGVTSGKDGPGGEPPAVDAVRCTAVAADAAFDAAAAVGPAPVASGRSGND